MAGGSVGIIQRASGRTPRHTVAILRTHHNGGLTIIGQQQKTPLQGMRFENLDEAQAYLDRWGTRWADTRIHGTTKRQVTGRRVDLVTPRFLNVRIRGRVLREAEPLHVAA